MLDAWIQIAPWKGATLKVKSIPRHLRQHSDVSCAETADPIDVVWVVDSDEPKETCIMPMTDAQETCTGNWYQKNW